MSGACGWHHSSYIKILIANPRLRRDAKRVRMHRELFKPHLGDRKFQPGIAGSVRDRCAARPTLPAFPPSLRLGGSMNGPDDIYLLLYYGYPSILYHTNLRVRAIPTASEKTPPVLLSRCFRPHRANAVGRYFNRGNENTATLSNPASRLRIPCGGVGYAATQPPATDPGPFGRVRK